MKKTVSLKENHLFRRAYNRGKSAAAWPSTSGATDSG